MRLHLERFSTSPHGTVGRMLVDGQFECYTLEDEVRDGEKVPGKTAIPAGKYRVTVTWSPRFKRHLPLLHQVPNFEGIRIHPGNTEADTEGCILVGNSIDMRAPAVLNSRVAFDRLLGRLLEAELHGEEIWIEIRNNFPVA